MYAFVWFFLLKFMIFLVIEGFLIGALIYKKIKPRIFWVLTGLIITISFTFIFPQCLMVSGIYIGVLAVVWIGYMISSTIGRFVWGIASFFLLFFSSGILLFAATTSNYYNYRVLYDENQEKYTVIELASKYSYFAQENVTIKYYTYKGYDIVASEIYKDSDSSFEYKRDLPETYEEYQRCIDFMEKQ